MKIRSGFVANSSSYSSVTCLGIIQKENLEKAKEVIDFFNRFLNNTSKIEIRKLTDLKTSIFDYDDDDYSNVYFDKNNKRIVLSGENYADHIAISLEEIKNFDTSYIATIGKTAESVLSIFENLFNDRDLFSNSIQEIYVEE